MEISQSLAAKTGSGQRAQPLLPALTKQPILLSNLSASTLYAESSVDSVVSSAISSMKGGRRRAPPPPPPRTSSRSPLASPLRTHPNFQPRPLPSLPSTAESNHFTMPLVMKVAPMSPALVSHSQPRTTSLPSTGSKILGVTDTRNTNNSRLSVSTQSSDQQVGAQDGQPVRPCSASSTNFICVRQTSQAESNSKN